MSEQDQRRHVDELLDSLLATYSDAEPRPGMETRLLANLRTASRQQIDNQAWAWKWLLAGAAAVGVVAVLFAVYWSRTPVVPPPKIQMAGPPTRPLAPGTSPPHESGHRKNRRVALPDAPPSARPEEVREALFPTPTPLSEQERLLMRYLAATPRTEIAAQSHKDKLMDDAGSLDPGAQRLNGTEGQTTNNEDTKEK